MRWIVVGTGAALILCGGAPLAIMVGNSRVTAELRSSPQGARAKRAMLITLPSGRTIPVNYLQEDEFVYAGADGRWWRELRGEGEEVTILVQGKTLTGRARAVEDDMERTHDVFARLRPTAPSWLPDWLNGVLIEIRVDTVPNTTGR